MTIDEAIKDYEDMKKGWYLIDPDELLDFTIEVMRKYQKIVQIMERTVDDGTSMYDTLQEIEEVIEDGEV